VNVRFTIRHKLVIFFALGLLTAVAPLVFGQGFGFRATLMTPSEVVAPYNAMPNRFSAALYPKTYLLLSTSLARNPVIEESSFSDNSLRFGVLLNQKLPMVPISVDAEKYYQQRSIQLERATNDTLLQKSIRQARQRKGSGKLAVNVPLPRRVERLVGEGGGNLTVSGSEQISFSGRSQWRDGVNTDQFRQSKFPALNMDQISRFEISGTVGSKISVRVSQDNQTDIPLANRIQIRYKGDEDDILRTVEAGNTTLSLPNTRFIGYSRSIQGLFGIKMEAAVGNLKLTTIASQEKGTSEHASVSAATEQGAKIIRDAQYSEGRVYDLFSKGDTWAMQPDDSIINYEIYEEMPVDSTQYPFAQALPDPYKLADSVNADRYRVRKLDPTPPTGTSQQMFTIFSDSSGNRHYVVFLTPKTTRALAVFYQFRRRLSSTVDTIITIGDISDAEYKLKKIRATYDKFVPSDPSWNMMWRNCYDIPLNSRIEDLDIKVYKGLPGSEESGDNVTYQLDAADKQYSYLSILGLDLYKGGGSSTRQPDGKVDDVTSIFKPEWGLLILPHQRPFDTDTTFRYQGGITPVLAERVPDIYDSRDQNRFKSSKYYFQLKSKSRSSIIRLNRMNIIAGSERLTLNGRQLVKDVDYNISYEIGQITLLKEEALDPNAQLSIDFEFAPYLALQKKTLFGMRAEYEVSKDLRLGSTFLYKSDKAEQRKPRVGQETSRGTVAGFDFSLNLYPKFLTKAVNALPLVTSDAPSTMTITAEVAQSRPNPNVTGVAYVDDFEGTVEQVSIGTSRVGWRLSSVPEPMKIAGDSVDQRRGRMLWYLPPSIQWDSVYKGERKAGEGLIQYFRMQYRPNTIGLGPEQPTAPGKHWAGIQTPIRTLDQDRLRLFEVRLRGRKGIMHVDIGQISEDVNNDGLDTKSENPDGNRHVDPTEDVGMDGQPDIAEPKYHPDTLPDPNRDDFRSYVGASSADFDNNPPPVAKSRLAAIKDSVLGSTTTPDILRYEWINGTEGNLVDAAAGDEPDQEAQISSSMQWQSNYYSYTIDLSDTAFLVDSSENIHGWRTYRLPIRDTTIPGFQHLGLNGTAPPTLAWNEANYVRIWFESDDTIKDTLAVDVANWYFVQSSWKDTVLPAITSPRKPRFYAASVSDQENTNFTPPPGVEAYYDQTNNVTEAQKAMALVYDSVFYRDTCLTVKELLSIDRYTGYRKMKMYVHGPPSAEQDSIKFFFRLGIDSKNFYEYQTDLDTGWAEGNYIDIDFNAMTAFKDSLIRFRDTTRRTPLDTSSGHYRVKGSPNLNQVKYLACGLINEDTTPGKTFIAGEIWVDELRVTDVRSDVGTAARVDLSGRMSDLITYNVNYLSQDPYFRGLSAATRGGSDNNLGSGKSDKNYGWGLGLALHKFLPRSWNVSLPVSFSSSHSEQLPLLATNSDIVLPSDARYAERTTSDRQGFSVSENIAKKSRNPLFSVLLNRQKLSFSYSRSIVRTPGVPYNLSEQYGFRGDYDMGYGGFKPLPILFWAKPIPILKSLSTAKLSYYPVSWRWSGSYNRNLSITEDNKRNRTSNFSRSLDVNMNLEYKMFQNISFSYTYMTRRDLTDSNDVRLSLKNFHPGLETAYSQSFRTGWSPQFVKFLGTNFSYSSAYNDNYDRQSRSKRGNMNNTWSLSGQFQHQLLLGGSAKQSGGTVGITKGKTSAPVKSGKPFYDYPKGWLRKLTSWINPISYKYQQTFNGSTPGMFERPGYAYQFGFRRNANVPVVNQSSSQPLSSEGMQYELASGFVLLGGLVLDVKLRRDINRDLVKVGDRIERVSSGWPDLNIRIQPFKSLPLVKGIVNKFIKVFTPRTAYGRQIREETNLTRGFRTSKATTTSRSPLLAINFKLLRALSMTGSYSTTTTESQSFSSVDGRNVSISRSRQKTLLITSQYAFSAPGGIGLPFLGKLKFKSQMQISTDIRFNSSFSEAGSEGQPIAKGKDATDFSVAPTVGYQFSPQIKGGLTARWQDSRDASNTKSHTRELRLWAEIRF
jgi:hypothetical protein